MRSSVSNIIVAALLLFVIMRTALRYSKQQMGDARYRAAVVDLMQQTRADLDRVAWHMGEWFPEEARRFRHVRDSIANFHLKLEGGQFDEPAMDNALHNLQDFVARNTLRPQEREALLRDLNRFLKPKEPPKQPAPQNKP